MTALLSNAIINPIVASAATLALILALRRISR